MRNRKKVRAVKVALPKPKTNQATPKNYDQKNTEKK